MMETVSIAVRGMSCGGCVKSVTRVLSALPGVTEVEVSLENATAIVRYEAGAVAIDAMVAAIDAAGFEAFVA